MKKTVIFNPAISSLNLGDHVISEGVKKQINPIIQDHFVIEVSTHLPISRMYMRHLKDSDYKFVAGSNLMRGKMNRIFRQWDIRLDQNDLVNNSILVGVGWWQYGDDPNLYTKRMYNSILSENYIHSVRDEYTKNQLLKVGIKNVINTSCATMWDLTEEKISEISPDKQKNVVFTLTDYNKDKINDAKFIEILKKNYESVYFWPQGTGDSDYIKELTSNLDGIKLINPNLDSYKNILNSPSIDYVGTRLHAGIKALQEDVRSIIIGIDNRALEKKKDFNLTVLNRENIEGLEDLINNKLQMEVIIPEKNITEWKSQFEQVTNFA